LIKGFSVSHDGYENEFAVKWFAAKLSEQRIAIDALMAQYNISEALKTVYKLIWDDFCSWYLEMIKPDFEKPIGPVTYQASIQYFRELMVTLHPFMPFITEELYQELREPDTAFQSICHVLSKDYAPADEQVLKQGQLLIELTTAIREVRAKNQIKPKEEVGLYYTGMAKENASLDAIKQTLFRLNYLNKLQEVEKPENTIPITVKGNTYYVEANREIDVAAEAERLQQELNYTRGFLESVMKKLSNERFVANAKADVVEKEKQKAADAEKKIQRLTEELFRLGIKK
jgi:valyl-tRNA synthetase